MEPRSDGARTEDDGRPTGDGPRDGGPHDEDPQDDGSPDDGPDGGGPGGRGPKADGPRDGDAPGDAVLPATPDLDAKPTGLLEATDADSGGLPGAGAVHPVRRG